MTNPTITKSIILKASPEHVWTFLTDPEKLGIWFHRPNTKLVTGTEYHVFSEKQGKNIMWGKVIDADEPKRLVYEFNILQSGDHTSRVTWTLTSVPGGTQLHLVHDQLPAVEQMFDLFVGLDSGWDGHIAKLREVAV